MSGTSHETEARSYELAGRDGDQEFVCSSGHPRCTAEGRGYVPGDENLAKDLVERQAKAYRAETDARVSELEFVREDWYTGRLAEGLAAASADQAANAQAGSRQEVEVT